MESPPVPSWCSCWPPAASSPSLLLGGGVQTLPLLIFQQFSTTRDFPLASAMSNVLLVLALACLFLQLRLIRRAGVS